MIKSTICSVNEQWDYAYHWVQTNRNILKSYIYSHKLLNYSAYDINDYLSECYLIAFEAKKRSGDERIEPIFWRLFKDKCSVMANKPLENSLYEDIYNIENFLEPDKADEPDHTDEVDADKYILEIKKILNILSPGQRQIFRLIAFAKKPMTVKEIAAALNISSQAVDARINNGLKKIRKYKNMEV